MKNLKDFGHNLKGFWSKSYWILVKILNFCQNLEGFWSKDFGHNLKGFGLKP